MRMREAINITSDPQDVGGPDLANRAWDPLWEVCADSLAGHRGKPLASRRTSPLGNAAQNALSGTASPQSRESANRIFDTGEPTWAAQAGGSDSGTQRVRRTSPIATVSPMARWPDGPMARWPDGPEGVLAQDRRTRPPACTRTLVRSWPRPPPRAPARLAPDSFKSVPSARRGRDRVVRRTQVLSCPLACVRGRGGT